MARGKSSEGALSPEEHVVDEVVRREFAFLASLGYAQPQTTAQESPLVGRITSWVFRNLRSARNCSVLLNCESGRESELDVIIWKTSGESDSADPLFVRLYLEAHRADVDQKRLKIRSYPPPLESQVAEVLRAYRYLLAEEAIDILKGRRWEAGHYPDWTA